MSSQTLEVECRRCCHAFAYPVMPENTVLDVMRRIALVHARNSGACARRFGATGIVVKHPDASSPLFPVGKEVA
jgi:hypothetical protein